MDLLLRQGRLGDKNIQAQLMEWVTYFEPQRSKQNHKRRPTSKTDDNAISEEIKRYKPHWRRASTQELLSLKLRIIFSEEPTYRKILSADSDNIKSKS